MATDLVFVSTYHNLPGVSDGLAIDYYSPGETLQQNLIPAVKHFIDLFSESGDYEDEFCNGDYDITDSFDEGEKDIFRLATDPALMKDWRENLSSLEVFNGCCAVVNACLRQPDIATNQRGIEIFNDLMESILLNDERGAGCEILIETSQSFGRRFITELLNEIRQPDEDQSHFRSFHLYGSNRDAIPPLGPLLEILESATRQDIWPRNDLALGKLLLVVDYYRELVKPW